MSLSSVPRVEEPLQSQGLIFKEKTGQAFWKNQWVRLSIQGRLSSQRFGIQITKGKDEQEGQTRCDPEGLLDFGGGQGTVICSLKPCKSILSLII